MLAGRQAEINISPAHWTKYEFRQSKMMHPNRIETEPAMNLKKKPPSPLPQQSRRLFNRQSGAALATSALFSKTAFAKTAQPKAKPNILYIMTDQQHARMMSCAGNRDLHTPAMDSLAEKGVRFERAYCTNPVCVPSRVSMMTGQYGSVTGVFSNSDARNINMPQSIMQNSMGHVLRKAGYRTVFAGKKHWTANMNNPEAIGFEYISRDERDDMADQCVEFLKQPHDQPFLLVASFINPHDICFMALDDWCTAQEKPLLYPHRKTERDILKDAMYENGEGRNSFDLDDCPALPRNHPIINDEPEMAAPTGGHGKYLRENWTERDWRLHRRAYARLTEQVDQHIGKILSALKENGLEENTLVVFSSDHGDMDASHKLEHKSQVYEEACNVPFIISRPGSLPESTTDSSHLISSGIDLLPTFMDAAGFTPDEYAHLPGKSILSLFTSSPLPWRKHVHIELKNADALVDSRYKYGIYESGKNREVLFDLENDPLEMVNLANHPDYREPLIQCRNTLKKTKQIGKTKTLDAHS
jgi:arylsulfatase A-like enzyme